MSVKRYRLIEGHEVGNFMDDGISLDEPEVTLASDYDALQFQVDALQAALDDLYSVQNGCPLPKYQTDWDAAMLAAGRLLGYRIPAADRGCHE